MSVKIYCTWRTVIIGCEAFKGNWIDWINPARCFRSSECKVEATHFLRQSETTFLCEKLNVVQFPFSLQITIFIVAVTGACVQAGQKSTQIAWGENQTVSPVQWTRTIYLRCELSVWECERLIRINCCLVSIRGKALAVFRMSLPNVKDQFYCCYFANDSGCDSTLTGVLTFCSISICLYADRKVCIMPFPSMSLCLGDKSIGHLCLWWRRAWERAWPVPSVGLSAQGYGDYGILRDGWNGLDWSTILVKFAHLRISHQRAILWESLR